MFVTDLGDLDGMLFVFDADLEGGFWMKNTLIPLDIVWFDSDGKWVGAETMPPCEADPCPTFGPGALYRYAVEAPALQLAFVTPETRLDLGVG